MARPKKVRIFDGVELADNLYLDSRGRHAYWRYKRPDGSFKIFEAATVLQANQIAKFNNENAEQMGGGKYIKRKGLLTGLVQDYIKYREQSSPSLKDKDSWRNRKYMLNQFATVMVAPLHTLTRADIWQWWETQTCHQQKARHAEFRRLFNYGMGKDLLPKLNYNPFTTNDDRPRLYVAANPGRKSQRITMGDFWLIYDAAGKLKFDGLQIAMGISLTTFMRAGDILTLKVSDNLEDNLLKKVIGKSEAMNGDAYASRLEWNVGDYDLLRQLIKRGRELSMLNHRCPFLVSHMPTIKRKGKTKEHVCQLTGRHLDTLFAKARYEAGFTGGHPPVFHGIRSLANKLAKDAGYAAEDIQQANAHKSIDTQLIYQDGHQLPFDKVSVQFTADQLGRTFG